jgi:hypothetical protein
MVLFVVVLAKEGQKAEACQEQTLTTATKRFVEEENRMVVA